jgi:CheY-like chemotaxis protein
MTNPKPPVSASGSNTPGHILVVDDEEMVRTLACRVLIEEGFGVHQAADGLEALDLVQSVGNKLECVVSDIVMPRLNGVELMERLSLLFPGLPVILMSGYGLTQLAGFGIATPCAVLSKPFPPDLLLAEVRRCLRPSGSNP